MKWFMPLFIVCGALIVTGCGSFTISGDDDEEVEINLFGLFSGDTEDVVTVTDEDGSKQTIGFETDEDGSIEISGTGDDGEESFSFGAGASSELHEEFPSDIPFPDSSQIIGSQRVSDDNEVMYTVQFIYAEEATKVYEMYKDYAHSYGYDDVREFESDTNYTVQGTMEDTRDAISLAITNYAEDEENVVILTVAKAR
ncbi:hypothetical protein ACM26V_14650 [Salipaludibacillus sp. HK11]|uniref:hypothetical protein n=1 Tax=Salipaludibacillus sp. HK11 TaxID=3394320 RepID=UPI0039FBDC89